MTTAVEGKRDIVSSDGATMEQIKKVFGEIFEGEVKMSDGAIEVKPILFVKRLFGIGCSISQIADILQLIENTCNICWDADIQKRPCYCASIDQFVIANSESK